MIITDQHIDLYARCPRRCSFEWENLPAASSAELSLFRTIAQKIVLFQTKNGYPPTWRRVFSWSSAEIDSLISATIEKDLFSQSQKLLTKLQQWYYNIFLPLGETVGVPNVPLELDLPRARLQLSADLLLWCPDPVFLQFEHGSKPTSERILFEKPSIYAKLWLIEQLLSVKVRHCRIVHVLPESIRVKDKILTDEQLRHGARSTDFILKGIQSSIYYPSISEQCDFCPHRTKCRF